MKLKFKASILTLAAVAAIYASCKKSDSNPSTKTLDSKTVTKQIALNLAQSFYGGLGGFNLNDGMNSPINVANPHHKGKLLNSLRVNDNCSMQLDTTLSIDITADTIQASVSGRFKIGMTCNNDNVSSLSVYDNLLMSMTTPSMTAKYTLGQNFLMTSSNPLDPEASIILNGSMTVKANIVYKNGKKSDMSFIYGLAGLTFDPSSDGDIKSGNASFHTTGSTPSGSWDYQGTIVFLGNHRVKITINGTAYTVDLLTQQFI